MDDKGSNSAPMTALNALMKVTKSYSIDSILGNDTCSVRPTNGLVYDPAALGHPPSLSFTGE